MTSGVLLVADAGRLGLPPPVKSPVVILDADTRLYKNPEKNKYRAEVWSVLLKDADPAKDTCLILPGGCGLEIPLLRKYGICDTSIIMIDERSAALARARQLTKTKAAGFCGKLSALTPPSKFFGKVTLANLDFCTNIFGALPEVQKFLAAGWLAPKAKLAVTFSLRGGSHTDGLLYYYGGDRVAALAAAIAHAGYHICSIHTSKYKNGPNRMGWAVFDLIDTGSILRHVERVGARAYRFLSWYNERLTKQLERREAFSLLEAVSAQHTVECVAMRLLIRLHYRKDMVSKVYSISLHDEFAVWREKIFWYAGNGGYIFKKIEEAKKRRVQSLRSAYLKQDPLLRLRETFAWQDENLAIRRMYSEPAEFNFTQAELSGVAAGGTSIIFWPAAHRILSGTTPRKENFCVHSAATLLRCSYKILDQLSKVCGLNLPHTSLSPNRRTYSRWRLRTLHDSDFWKENASEIRRQPALFFKKTFPPVPALRLFHVPLEPKARPISIPASVTREAEEAVNRKHSFDDWRQRYGELLKRYDARLAKRFTLQDTVWADGIRNCFFPAKHDFSLVDVMHARICLDRFIRHLDKKLHGRFAVEEQKRRYFFLDFPYFAPPACYLVDVVDWPSERGNRTRRTGALQEISFQLETTSYLSGNTLLSCDEDGSKKQAEHLRVQYLINCGVEPVYSIREAMKHLGCTWVALRKFKIRSYRLCGLPVYRQFDIMHFTYSTAYQEHKRAKRLRKKVKRQKVWA